MYLKVKAKIDRWIFLNKNRRFLKGFKSHGLNVSIRQPVCIEGREFVELGDNVSIAAFVHIWGFGGVKIGNRVMIASHVAISTITHDHSKEKMFDTVISKSITINDDVWIGTHAVILPGVTIGKGAVIGAGSLVLRDVKENEVVGGVPAEILKMRVIGKD